MSGDPLAPVVRGDPLRLTAAAWNAVTSAAKQVRDRSFTTPAPGGTAWGGVVEAFGLNDTGGDLREYRPATVTDAGGYELPANDTLWQRSPLLTLSDFTATDEFVCVTLEAIPDGQIGRVAVLGAVLCDVEILDAGHGFAAPAVGDTDRLHSASSGPVRLLHVPAGAGSTKRCVVLLAGGGGGAGGYTSYTADGIVRADARPPSADTSQLPVQNLGRGPKGIRNGYLRVWFGQNHGDGGRFANPGDDT